MKALNPLPGLVALKGIKALTTGPAAGIGKAIAYRFAEVGAGLELVDSNREGLLASDLSSYAHGAPVPVDGGFLSA